MIRIGKASLYIASICSVMYEERDLRLKAGEGER